MAQLTRFKYFGQFGPTLRMLRQKAAYSLRQFAAMVGLSPSYLSRIERGKDPPPPETKIKRIAELLGGEPDDWLAAAGRVAYDLQLIIRLHPALYGALLRSLSRLPYLEMSAKVEWIIGRPIPRE